MHDFRRLHGWRLARELGSDVFRETAKASHPELRLSTSQLRHSARSIASNIAEGCAKNSRAETLRYSEISAGSAAETEHHLLVANVPRTLYRSGRAPRKDPYALPPIASANFFIASSCSGVSLSGTVTLTSTIRSPRDPSRSIP
jgi:four helix bundle protein